MFPILFDGSRHSRGRIPQPIRFPLLQVVQNLGRLTLRAQMDVCSLRTARRVTKEGSHAAAELLADTKKRVQRHPIEAIAAAFTAGVVAGSAIRWMIKRRQS